MGRGSFGSCRVAGWSDQLSRLGDEERVPGRSRWTERDPLATQPATWTFVLLMVAIVVDDRPRWLCPTVGCGTVIGDTRKLSRVMLAQQIFTHCLEQRGQHQQKVEDECPGGSHSRCGLSTTEPVSSAQSNESGFSFQSTKMSRTRRGARSSG